MHAYQNNGFPLPPIVFHLLVVEKALQIQGKYFIYLINSLLLVPWSKALRKLSTDVYQFNKRIP